MSLRCRPPGITVTMLLDYTAATTPSCSTQLISHKIVGGCRQNLSRSADCGYEAIEIDFCNWRNIDATLLFRKTPEWKVEEEARILLMPRGSPQVVRFDPPELLNRIILGKRVNEENRQVIRRWCEKRNPTLLVVDEQG